MIKLIKLHSNYLLNKRVLFVILLLTTIFLICLFFSSGISTSKFEKQMYLYEYKYDYKNSGFIMIKFTQIILSILLFSYCFDKNQDQYIPFILTRGISKEKYFISKVLTAWIVISIYWSLLIILFYIFGNICLSIKTMNISRLLLIYLLSMLYGMYSLIFVLLINTSMISVLMILSFWISEVLVGSSEILDIILPSIQNGEFKYGCEYVIILITLIFLLNTYIYTSRQLV
ncbi:hypothetical protein KHQ82_06965 [Mycoplasmatota bacterium]|nr:hypothetical protein KHQ82_06965 [Mycoplasmatota bacterium]